MRKSILFSAVLTLFLLVPASITWAQTVSLTGVVYENSMVKIPFSTPHGNIITILPADMAAGDVITGTVQCVPEGNTQKQRKNNLGELRKYTLFFGEEIPLRAALPPDANDAGKYCTTFIIPSDSNSAFLNIKLKNSSNNTIGHSRLPLMDKAFLMPLQDIFSVPGRGVVIDTPKTKPRTNRPFRIDINNDKKVYIAGEPATIFIKPLTSNEDILLPGFEFVVYDPENQQIRDSKIKLQPVTISPRKTVIGIPKNVQGAGEIIITDENSRPLTSQKLHVLKLEASAPKTSLLKGESTLMNVKVTGFKDCPVPYVRISINNATANTVQLGNSNQEDLLVETVSMNYSKITHEYKTQDEKKEKVDPEQNRELTGEDEISLQRNITALQSGSFNILVRLSYPSSAYNDPFSRQIDALKTPAQFINWQNALMNDLRTYNETINAMLPSYSGPAPSDWSQSLINKYLGHIFDRESALPVNYYYELNKKINIGEKSLKRPATAGELNEAKSFAYNFTNSFQLPSEIVEKYFSCTLEAGNAAVENAVNQTDTPVDFVPVQSALRYTEQQAAIAGNNQLQNAAADLTKDELLKLQKQINKLSERYRIMKYLQEMFGDAAKSSVNNMRASVSPSTKPDQAKLVNNPSDEIDLGGLIGYYDPLKEIFIVENGKEKQLLQQAGARNTGAGSYSMSSYNLYREPVNCDFRLQSVNKTELYKAAFDSEVKWNVAFMLQDAAKSNLPDNTRQPQGDTLKTKKGTTIVVFEGRKCKKLHEGKFEDCHTLTDYVYNKSSGQMEKVEIYNKAEWFPIGKCSEKTVEVDIPCIEFKVMYCRITYYYDKECKLPLKDSVLWSYSCMFK